MSLLVIPCVVLVGILLVFRQRTPVRQPSGVPTIPSFLPWIGAAIEFGRNSYAFLARCQATYGPIFNIRLGNAKVAVLCNEEGIEDVFRDKTRAFTTYSAHGRIIRAIGDAQEDASHILVDRLFPIMGRAFASTDGLSLVAPVYNEEIYSLLSNFGDALGNTSKDIPLKRFVGQNIYKAISRTVFGELFPSDDYDDFQLVDDNFPLLMSPFSFIARGAIRARSHLIHSIAEYFEVAWKDSRLEGASRVATELYSTLRNAGLSRTEEAGVLLTMIWGLHSNTINTIHWLLAHLLVDPDSFSVIRAEIDSVVKSDYGGSIKTLLSSSPTSIGAQHFPLLDSAVKETLRLTVFLPTLREARKDADINYGEGRSATIHEGSLVLLNLRALHHSEELGGDGSRFSMGRYLSEEKEEVGIPGERAPPFWAFGGGMHLCKGRYLALHEIKIFFIVCVKLFDMILVDESGDPLRQLPPLDPSSAGAARPTKALYVRLRARRAMG